MIRSRQRNYRHAHIEGVAGRPAAGIREGIERDVHIGVFAQILPRQRTQGQPLRHNPRPGDPLHRVSAAIRRAKHVGLEKKPRIRHLPQNFCPCRQHLVGHLGKIIKAAKRHIAVFFAGRRRHRRLLAARRIAKMAVWQYQELLRKSVLLRRVVKIDVAEEIIDGGKPRRGEIADP